MITGFWTLYIHSDISPLPWPLMGCDYHYIHHRYNWYNFGFMTLLFDELFRTVKHPRQDARAFALGEKVRPGPPPAPPLGPGPARHDPLLVAPSFQPPRRPLRRRCRSTRRSDPPT